MSILPKNIDMFRQNIKTGVLLLSFLAIFLLDRQGFYKKEKDPEKLIFSGSWRNGKLEGDNGEPFFLIVNDGRVSGHVAD